MIHLNTQSTTTDTQQLIESVSPTSRAPGAWPAHATALELDTNVDVLDLGTAAVPPGFWPNVRRPSIRKQDREAVMACLDRALAWEVDGEFDRRVDEINRELEAIESGCVEPPPLGWLQEIGKPR